MDIILNMNMEKYEHTLNTDMKKYGYNFEYRYEKIWK